MNTSCDRRLLLRYIAIFLLWACSAGVLSAQRVWHQGDMWLKWGHDAREAYIFGYLNGYRDGHGDGCKQLLTGDAPSHQTDQVERCRDTEEIDYSKGTTYFDNLLTDFYKRYPGDRELDIQEVLNLLLRGLTLEQIHHHPFPRHNTPTHD